MEPCSAKLDPTNWTQPYKSMIEDLLVIDPDLSSMTFFQENRTEYHLDVSRIHLAKDASSDFYSAMIFTEFVVVIWPKHEDGVATLIQRLWKRLTEGPQSIVAYVPDDRSTDGIRYYQRVNGRFVRMNPGFVFRPPVVKSPLAPEVYGDPGSYVYKVAATEPINVSVAEPRADSGSIFANWPKSTQEVKHERKYSVLIARFPGQHQEHPDSSNWVIDTIRKMDRDPRISKVGRFTKSDTPITMVRNEAVKMALAADVDYLLMIDADMSPDLDLPNAKPFWDSSWEWMMKRRENEEKYRYRAQDGVTQLHADGSPVRSNEPGFAFAPATIAAPYCGPSPNEHCYIFKWKSRESGSANKNFKLAMFEREDAALRGGIEEVAALPTGLILYDMRVFKALPKPWFDYEWADAERSAKASTEDVYQTRNASLLGFPQYVNWDAWAGHVKLKTVGKPVVHTVEDVSEALRGAIVGGHHRGDQVRIMDCQRPPVRTIEELASDARL